MRGWIVCLISAALALVSFPNSSYAQTKLKKIRVGVPSVGVANIIIFVTKEANLYAKYGLDGEVITINGSGIASKALISGNIDVCPIATPTVIAANLAGSDMSILAHTMPGVVHALMVKPEIKRVEDLKGKKNCGIEPWIADRLFGQVHREEKRAEPGSGSDVHPDGRRRGAHRRS